MLRVEKSRRSNVDDAQSLLAPHDTRPTKRHAPSSSVSIALSELTSRDQETLFGSLLKLQLHQKKNDRVIVRDALLLSGSYVMVPACGMGHRDLNSVHYTHALGRRRMQGSTTGILHAHDLTSSYDIIALDKSLLAHTRLEQHLPPKQKMILSTYQMLSKLIDHLKPYVIIDAFKDTTSLALQFKQPGIQNGDMQYYPSGYTEGHWHEERRRTRLNHASIIPSTRIILDVVIDAFPYMRLIFEYGTDGRMALTETKHGLDTDNKDYHKQWRSIRKVYTRSNHDYKPPNFPMLNLSSLLGLGFRGNDDGPKFSRHHIIPKPLLRLLGQLTYDNGIPAPILQHYTQTLRSVSWQNHQNYSDNRLMLEAVIWSPWNLFIGPSNRLHGKIPGSDPDDGLEKNKPPSFPQKLWDKIEKVYGALRNYIVTCYALDKNASEKLVLQTVQSINSVYLQRDNRDITDQTHRLPPLLINAPIKRYNADKLPRLVTELTDRLGYLRDCKWPHSSPHSTQDIISTGHIIRTSPNDWDYHPEKGGYTLKISQ